MRPKLLGREPTKSGQPWYTVFTYEGVYTVFTYEGVYTVFTYEGVYTVFTYDGICACGICANGICAIVPYPFGAATELYICMYSMYSMYVYVLVH